MTIRKSALVTGAGSGIGRAVAIALQDAGYNVALAGRRQSELERTAGESRGAVRLDGAGSRQHMLVVPTDVSDPESVRALFARIKEVFGRLDLLFNNAGCGAPGVPIEDL